MTSEIVARWLVAFAITQIVECPIYVRGFGVTLRRAFLASAITHPIVTLAMFAAPSASFVVVGLVAEVFAVLFEAWWIRRHTRRALVASVVANVASSALGGVVYLLTGWP
jgi:hypothetical protein